MASPLPTCRMNVLVTDNESYLKSCRYSTEHPYCPIFLLGNIVRWAGSDFHEMALEVGVCFSSSLYCSLGGCEAQGSASQPGLQEIMLFLKITLVPFILFPGNGKQGSVGPLEEMLGSGFCYLGLLRKRCSRLLNHWLRPRTLGCQRCSPCSGNTP